MEKKDQNQKLRQRFPAQLFIMISRVTDVLYRAISYRHVHENVFAKFGTNILIAT